MVVAQRLAAKDRGGGVVSAVAGRRGAKTRLIGIMILFLGLLNAMLSWRGGFALNAFPVVLIGVGLFVYTLGAIRRTAGE